VWGKFVQFPLLGERVRVRGMDAGWRFFTLTSVLSPIEEDGENQGIRKHFLA
jgi:hypothetical protein